MTPLELQNDLRALLFERLQINEAKGINLGPPPKRNTLKGMLRGLRVGGSGVRNVVSGTVNAIRATGPGLRQAVSGAQTAATGARMTVQHAARGIRPVVRKFPLTSLVLATGLGVAAGHYVPKAIDAIKGTRTGTRHVYQGGGGIDEPRRYPTITPERNTGRQYTGTDEMYEPHGPLSTRRRVRALDDMYEAIAFETLKESLRIKLMARL
jgi:hypothetical protein